ncbi:hypothetical protein V1Y59_21560 [Gordonia sp. PKS22-38]|uniref:Transmembrane protein n=1 Tax=Gordonia prachuapensis TaxID=3115651 RepID=A0ABU7MZE6_9ACTN|nr:hypothetical protein [Gordonia sp. PKS22-38]
MTENRSTPPPSAESGGGGATDRGPDRRVRRRDVEKRWDDPGAFRRAALYVVGVLAVAAVMVALYLSVGRESVIWASGPPAAFLLGGVGALVIAYRVYRRGGTWPIWQGAAWFLLALLLVALSFPLTAV